MPIGRLAVIDGMETGRRTAMVIVCTKAQVQKQTAVAGIVCGCEEGPRGVCGHGSTATGRVIVNLQDTTVAGGP